MVDEAPGIVKRADGKTFSYLANGTGDGIGRSTSKRVMSSLSSSTTFMELVAAAAAQPNRQDEPRRNEPRRERAGTRRGRAPSASTRPASGPRARTQPTVLVVDDAADTREMYGSYLGFRGFGVLTAPDGDAAVETALARHPDVIVMDLAMPRLNGISAVHRLKQHRARAPSRSSSSRATRSAPSSRARSRPAPTSS